MKINAAIVKQAAEHVSSFLSKELTDVYCYHDLAHTQDVVNAVNGIASGMKLTDHEKYILNVAAWFHDIGYVDNPDAHEPTAAAMAAKFLEANKVDSDDVRKVKGCILATKYPQHPSGLLEQIICDADMLHLGRKEYFKKSALIREEWRLAKGENHNELQWLRLNIDFITNHRFHTRFCRENFDSRKAKNLVHLKTLEKQEAKKSPPNNGDKDKPQRGVETLFRTAARNHMQLSGMADSKAHILLSINSIIISIIISVLLKKLEESTYLIGPTVFLLLVCLASIVFAVLTTKPKVSKGVFTKEQVQKREANLMFFGNFHNMDIDTYNWGVKEMMSDNEYLYSSMAKDIYFLGKVLAIKYRYLSTGYMVFMFGMIASVFAFAICFWMH